MRPLKTDYRRRAGFTLIELLIVMTIMLSLAALTFSVISFSIETDRIQGGARQIQSYLEGARDRALYAGQPRGVRFLLRNNAPTATVADSMVFVGASGTFSSGFIGIANDGLGNPVVVTPPVDPAGGGGTTLWDSLTTRGLLNPNGARIKIANSFYTVFFDLTSSTWQLTSNSAGGPGVGIAYELDLEPSVLPNQEPRLLPQNVVIDLDPSRFTVGPDGEPGVAGVDDDGVGGVDDAGELGFGGSDDVYAGKLPTAWYDSVAGLYVQNSMDIMFSPRGNVMGNPAATGMIHLILSDQDDVDAGLLPGDTNKEGGELITTITPQTGNISTHPIDPADVFHLAEYGEVVR